MANDENDASLWFHGKLSRRDAETRLQAARAPNSFLVRESDRKAGSFVLSFRSAANNQINHFRVNAVCGDYYIGGRQFGSLAALVRHYTRDADLLRDERLQTPIAPPTPVDSARRVVAVLPYTALADSDELSFFAGDMFVVRAECGDGWLWCARLPTLEAGLVFGELVEPLDDDVDPNEAYAWFHSRLTKQEAVERLAKAGPGAYLVRPSDNSPGDYSLFFFAVDAVQRFRIERRGQHYLMGGRLFASLQAVIDRYTDEQIADGCRLRTPVVKAPFDETRWSSRHAQLVRNKADVYATLRESREAAKRDESVRMKGFLAKKSKKHKKWRNLFFVLNSKQSILYFYDSPRRTRPRGLVDLAYTSLYSVHESLFDKAHAFQLVERALPCLSTTYYLSAADANTAHEWTTAIKQLCLPRTSAQSVTHVRTLFVSLIEARGLPVKYVQHPMFVLALNAVKIARTQVKCPPDPILEEDFVLEDIPPDVTTFSITLYNSKGKRSKDVEIAETVLELARLTAGEEVEQNVALTGLCPPIREEWGALRLRIRFQHEVIMPFGEYSALRDLVLSEDLEVVAVCEQFCARDRAPLANALLKIARHARKELCLLRAMVEREIRLESDTSTLFRSNSLTTALLDHYMGACCQAFVRAALHESVERVLESRQSCELNPAKLDSELSAVANAEHLLAFLDQFVEAVFRSVAHCPPALRYLCGQMQRAVVGKWPHEPLVRTRVVSGFVFLRLLCPAILNPRHFALTNETPSETAARTLILIAKSLQNLANLVEFGVKEPWMEIVNPFILKNKARMIKFVDDLSAVAACPPPDAEFDYEPARELALVHACVEANGDRLDANQSAVIRKLLAVSEMLSRRRARFAAQNNTTTDNTTDNNGLSDELLTVFTNRNEK